MKKQSEIQKIAAVDAANEMLAALDSTAEDFEKQGNYEASYQIDLARHYLKKAVDEGELENIEVPIDLFEKSSQDLSLPKNDVGGIELIDEDPFEGLKMDVNEDNVDDDKDEKAEEVEKLNDELECGLKAFDYNKVAYIDNREERLAKLAKN